MPGAWGLCFGLEEDCGQTAGLSQTRNLASHHLLAAAEGRICRVASLANKQWTAMLVVPRPRARKPATQRSERWVPAEQQRWRDPRERADGRGQLHPAAGQLCRSLAQSGSRICHRAIG